MSDDVDFMPVSPDPKKGSKPEAAKPESSPVASVLAEPEERAELPTWNRTRRKRKSTVQAAEQDDAFQRGVRKAGRQAIDFPKLVIGSIVIGVAAIAAVVVLGQRSSTVNAEASRVLAVATTAIVRGQILPAEDQERLADQIARARFPVHGTQAERDQAISEALDAALAVDREEVALDAQLVAAAHQVRGGDFAAALELYDAFLAAAGDDHPLRFLAIEGKGIAQEASEDYEGALATFQQLAPRPTDFHRGMALYHQGRVLEALERDDEALAIYEQFFVEFPPSSPVLGTSLVRERAEKLDPDFADRVAVPPAFDPGFDSAPPMPEMPPDGP